MNEECLICGAPLVYLQAEEEMECALCGNKTKSRARCANGHFVCDSCHGSGVGAALALCLASQSSDPIEILEAMMSLPSCHMHGPEHHVLVGAALLTAYKNAGGAIDLPTALAEMQKRGRDVPGGACGFWGACGAGVSTGIFVSIARSATPLATEAWSMANRMTSQALASIAAHGGPRCCKRDSYLAVTEAIRFSREQLGVNMKESRVTCTRSHCNAQCLHSSCPFYKA